MEKESKREAYHRQVAEKIIQQLEQGTAPWQRPWSDTEAMPFNATTGKAYKGVNVLQLLSEGYSDPRWMTYVQAKSIGAQVKAGEKGTVIHYTKYEEERVKRDEQGKPIKDENGKTVKETVKLIRPKNFQSHVFNIEQIDNHNLPPLPPKSQQPNWNPILRHQAGNRAFYHQATDSITLPEKSQFPSAESYYDVALHELGHWTGHESRLNRDIKHGFGSQGYAKEELRAEIASMMLAANIGIAHDTEQNAAYVKSWIKVLKDDPQEIYRAAKDAEQIQKYVLGLEHKQQLEQEQQAEQAAEVQAQSPQVQVSLEPGPLQIPEAEQVYAENSARLEQLLTAHPEAIVQQMQQIARGIAESGYASQRIYESALPADWTGELQIVGMVHGVDGEASGYRRADELGMPPQFHAVYAIRGEAQPDENPWTLITASSTVEGAQERLEQIRLIDALANTNPYQQATTLALIEAERVWNNSRATDEEKEEVREALDIVNALAEMAEQQATGLAETLAPKIDEAKAEQAPEAIRATQLLNALIQDHGWTKHKVDGQSIAASRDFDIGGFGRTDYLIAGFQFDPENLQTVDLSHNNRNIAFTTIAEWDSATLEPRELAKQINQSALQYADQKRIQNSLEPIYQQAQAEREQAAQPEPEQPAPASAPSAEQEPPPPELPTAAQVAEANKAKIETLLAAHPAQTGERLREAAYALQKDGLDSHPVFGQTLPHDWTGEVQIVPSVRDIESGQIIPAEFAGRESEGYGVYARKGEAKEGEQTWQAITATKAEEQAQNRAEQLQLLDALLQSNPYEQAVQLATIDKKRVDRHPEATDEQRIEAKEALKSAQSAAHLAEIQQTLQSQSVKQAQSAEPQTERHYLKTEFKDREEVKNLGAKWDKEEKLWYVPEGVDKAPFAKWSQTTPEQAKAERAEQQAKRTESPAPVARTEPVKRQYLAVPIERKDEAKAAGARWDKTARAWYAGPQADMKALDKFRPENIRIQQELPIRPQEEFAAAMRSIGLIVDGEHPIMDGKSHRVAVGGGKKGAKDGFYVGHLDGRPAGSISNNRTGAKISWKSNATVLTDAQRAKLAAEAAENRAAREHEKQQLQEQAAERVSQQFQSLKPISAPTPYLEQKGIGIHQGVKTGQDGKATIVPAYDADGKHWTTQYIQEDGSKRFAKDGRKKGCFHPVGGMEALKSAPVLVIAEGYATAASLSEAVGHATVVAFDSGNLKEVAQALHEKYPNKPIVIAGDDDKKQEQQNGRNPGREKATAAAAAVDGAAIFPIFAPAEQQNKGLSDFNDLATKSELGKDGLKRQVTAAIRQEQQRHQQRREQQQKLAVKQEAGMRM